MPQSHSEIFNRGANVAGPSSFTLFPSLPAEIRVSIWTWALRHQRIIKIFLRSHAGFCGNRTRNGIHFPPLEPGRDDPTYYPVVDGHRLLSKLLRVNTESREAVLSFHRVHIPCWFADREDNYGLWTSGTTYINPEYDFLHIQEDTMATVEFVCDLKIKHDPRNVGIRNLALCSNQLGGRPSGLHAMRPADIESSKMRIFREIISGLDEVWLISIQESIRQLIGGENEWPAVRKTFFERSVPIHATPHSFERIGLDPRTVEDDLSHLHVRNPKRLYDSWLQVLERIEVKPCEERYRLLLAFNPRRTICNLRDAEDWLQWEGNGWVAKPGSTWPSQEPQIERVASEPTESRDEDITKAVRPAFGFWLFPVDAFCDANKTGEPQGYITTFDVRKHRPELALLLLNEGDTDRNVSAEVVARNNIILEPRLLRLSQRRRAPLYDPGLEVPVPWTDIRNSSQEQ
ncbi:uncharacterized protein FMAN_16047 [Fusarium mangiferae]|uniref:2EXR domain-containing protein n=1 Tax=Fusarium mangiferae TaxID=192010 RepID=A0A1L7SPT7_FUSMA|nr:uncharacterized protein FMAN_16047 [Fusarium mangiferae]CVK86453.1 uncharacterized protein FMAN_16047 [Fusarium mangiferae]